MKSSEFTPGTNKAKKKREKKNEKALQGKSPEVPNPDFEVVLIQKG